MYAQHWMFGKKMNKNFCGQSGANLTDRVPRVEFCKTNFGDGVHYDSKNKFDMIRFSCSEDAMTSGWAFCNFKFSSKH